MHCFGVARAISANPTFLFAALSDSAILGKQVFLISPALEYRVASLRARVVALVGITGAVPSRKGGVVKYLKSLVGPAVVPLSRENKHLALANDLTGALKDKRYFHRLLTVRA
jgi:hypothetical protein